jgi:Lrp/AsnC family transcriptional regulator, leucine-responsive regulatory protein
MASTSQFGVFAIEPKAKIMKRLRSIGARLDAVDRKLIRLLDGKARTSTADLARALGMSAPSVAERMRRLEESGVIRRFTVDIDPAALGYPLAVYLRIRPSAGQHAKVTELVAELPEVVQCDRITGDDCFLARAHVRSVEDLELLIDRITPYAQTNTSVIQSSPVARRLPPL